MKKKISFSIGSQGLVHPALRIYYSSLYCKNFQEIQKSVVSECSKCTVEEASKKTELLFLKDNKCAATLKPINVTNMYTQGCVSEGGNQIWRCDNAVCRCSNTWEWLKH